MFLAHVRPLIHQHPHIHLCGDALNPFIPQPLLTPGVVPTQVQQLAFVFVEPYEAPVGSLLELVQVPLGNISSLGHFKVSSLLSIDANLI